MRKKKNSDDGDMNEWLNTYADMVTLLLCFFVLLYSMSSIDSQKWEVLVKSLNPNSEEVSQIVEDATNTEGEYDVQSAFKTPDELQPEDFDNLYYRLKEYVKQNELESEITVSKGEDYTFIMFTNQVFFDGDSYVIKDNGKKILDVVANGIKDVNEQIGEISILGHTSQARPDQVNELVSDRFLASNRATQVLVYLQEKNIIDPSKLVSSGYGQFRPISSFDTSANRAKNRRVEILITKKNSATLKLDDYYKAVYK